MKLVCLLQLYFSSKTLRFLSNRSMKYLSIIKSNLRLRRQEVKIGQFNDIMYCITFFLERKNQPFYFRTLALNLKQVISFLGSLGEGS